MPLAAVLFDLDGVLIDSRALWFELLNAAARAFDHAPLERPAFDASFGQGVEADAQQFFGGMPAVELERWFDAHFLDHAGALEVNPDATAVFQALAQRGVARAVVTNSSSALASEVVRGAGLDPDVLVGSSDVVQPKPAPEGILLACERLAIAPNEAWMVGDSRFDREAARAAEVPFVGYRTEGPRRIERLSELLFLPAG